MGDFERFYNIALRFLSYRPRSEKEVRENLKILIKRHSGDLSADGDSRIENGFWTSQNDDKESIIEKVISKLKEQKFINDSEFAKWWIESRMRFKPMSLRLIKLELKQKGVDKDLINKVINDEGLMINDSENAKKLVEKKFARFKNLSKEEIYQKLGRYLASKGFDWETIKKSIDESLGKGV